MVKKKNKTFNWFNSTIAIMVLLFIITFPLSIWRFGINRVIDQLLLWTLGSVTVGLLLFAMKKYMIKN